MAAILRGSVAVAWNGSPQAARAIAASLALVARAAEIVVIHAGADAAIVRPAVDFLAAHGLRARMRCIEPDGDTGILIESAVRESGSGLLVMGAYSHARAREFVFGGVTRYMLSQAAFPLLLTH